MGKKADNIKVLFEKARSGDVKELPLLTRAFTNWLRLSFQEERSQHLDAQLLEKCLDSLSKLIRKIEKIENAYWKTKAVEMLSRLMETIYTTRNLEPAVKHLESILHGFAGISRDQDMVKKLGDTIDLLTGQPRQTAVESPPANNRKFSPIRKKRGGCTTSAFMNKIIKDVIETKIPGQIKDGINDMFDQLEGRIKAKTPEEMLQKKIKKKAPDTEVKIRKILGHPEGKIKMEAIEASKRGEAGDVIKGQINEMVKKESPVTFSVYWQHYVKPRIWTDLMVYLYSGSRGKEETYEDLLKQVKNPDKFDFNISGPMDIKWGTKILIKPEMPGFRFAPEEMIVAWYEDWVPVVFKMMTELKGPFPPVGEKVKGKVNFFVGPLPINEIDINVIIKEHLSGDEKIERNEKANPAYRKIFPSYAREDLEIVKKIETAFDAFGDKYMFDLKTLRAGEKWKPRLLELIQISDIFHLFWSEASEKSKYVEMEWREALKRVKRGEDNFIRPVYWKLPKPAPPSELKDINFKYKKF
jgi:hypothetical protein